MGINDTNHRIHKIESQTYETRKYMQNEKLKKEKQLITT